MSQTHGVSSEHIHTFKFIENPQFAAICLFNLRMMDPNIGWFQPEHKGPAYETWNKVWHETNPNLKLSAQPEFIPIEEDADLKSNGKKGRSLSSLDQLTNGPNKKMRRDNPASTYNYDNNQHLVQKYNGTPWRSLRNKYSHGIVGLHEEIEDFYEWIKPRQEEFAIRKDVVSRIASVVRKIWPQAKV